MLWVGVVGAVLLLLRVVPRSLWDKGGRPGCNPPGPPTTHVWVSERVCECCSFACVSTLLDGVSRELDKSPLALHRRRSRCTGNTTPKAHSMQPHWPRFSAPAQSMLRSKGTCAAPTEPPSTVITLPVHQAPARDARNSAAPAMSSGVPRRPMGTLLEMASAEA